jgi:hypothetical protein
MVLRCVCGEAMTSLIILVLSDYWILKEGLKNWS